ncbi:MAG: 50S ribosomal protein L10 [Ignavibacteria bacterium]|jgi:large subunit ribosomal protein L10|nr:50S ribosomal protein L10 [Ignavibacteria bacterium]
MITKDKKKEIVAKLVEKFKDADAFYFIDFQKMTVKEISQFRRSLRASESDIYVAKNTLIDLALKEIGKSDKIQSEILKGQTAVIFASKEVLAPAKLIKEQFDKLAKPIFKAASIEGEYFDSTMLKQLASLPSKAENIASILGSLDAPISGIIGSINAVMRDLASLIEEVAKQKAA